MLVLIKTKEGFDRAVNISNVEFEARTNPEDANSMILTIRKPNGETIEGAIPEEKYRQMLEILERENKLIVL